ncbi:MAG: hypothetical protein AAGA86_08615 [Bacteroidota bacterium]
MKDQCAQAHRPVHHATLQTRHVFSENNQVFLKQEASASKTHKNDQWFPVNFQWMPVVALKNELENPNNTALWEQK